MSEQDIWVLIFALMVILAFGLWFIFGKVVDW
jgi:hypothetical protein